MRPFTRFAYAIGLLMIAPLPGEGVAPDAAQKQDMINVATRNFSDVEMLCRAHPDFCQFAAEIAYNVEAKARSGIGFFYSLTADAMTPGMRGTVIAASVLPAPVD